MTTTDLTEHLDSIYVALNKVMKQVEAVKKDRKVQTGPARFNFRGVDDVVNAVSPALQEHGVIVVPHKVMELREERYETSGGSKMHGIIIRIWWRFYGPNGSFIDVESAGQSSDSGDKAVPKAHSVAYRTALLQALCIPTDDPDPDESVHVRADAEPPKPRDWAIEVLACKNEAELTALAKQASALGQWSEAVASCFTGRKEQLAEEQRQAGMDEKDKAMREAIALSEKKLDATEVPSE